MSEIAKIVQPQQKRAELMIRDAIPVFDTARFEQMQRIASVMADATIIPQKIRKGDTERQRAANCFLIVNQAVRWNMDPFSLAQHAYFVGDKLAFDGQAISAAINTDPELIGRLELEYSGEEDTDDRRIKVSGTFRDTGKTVSIEGTVKRWKTANEQWKSERDQMLAYRGARVWARRHKSDRIMGIYSVDELQDMQGRMGPEATQRPMRDVTPIVPDIPPAPEQPAQAPAEGKMEAVDPKTTFLNGLRTKLEEAKDLIALEESFELERTTISGLDLVTKAQEIYDLVESGFNQE